MTAQMASRMTCFAVLSAIETDVRDLLRKLSQDSGNLTFLPADLRQNATPRYLVDQGMEDTVQMIEDLDLLPYLDFADLAKAINRLDAAFLKMDSQGTTWLSENLIRMAPSRHRVCHSRPLEVEDVPNFIDFANDIINQYRTLSWEQIQLTLEKLQQDPSYVFYLAIPEFWQAGRSKILNNLPIAEFHDTGFVGRREDLRAFNKQLMSANPVISLLGEGGAGKTALALKGLYDIVENPKCPFELIVWVTLKTKILRADGARLISNAISSTAPLLEFIEGQLPRPDGEIQNSNMQESIDRIIDYMTVFKTILAIDNLETIEHEELRELYSAIPAGSKLVITSRIGLGEVEFRVPVQAMKSDDSSTLFRSYAKFLHKNDLASSRSEVVNAFCSRLLHNPLLIKWFLGSVADGRDPNDLLAPDSADLDDALRFCFENLYRLLPENQLLVVQTLSCAGRPLASPELRFLLQGKLEGNALQMALNQMHRSSILRNETEQVSLHGKTVTKYSLTDIASQYVSRNASPPTELYNEVQRGLSSLQATEQAENIKLATFKYDKYVLNSRNRFDFVTARDLGEALSYLKGGAYESAHTAVNRARSLDPSFSEVDRIEAMIYAHEEKPQEAESHFKYSLELNPHSAITLVSYSDFLLNCDRYADGLAKLEKVIEQDPQDSFLLKSKAVFFTRLGRYSEADVLYQRVLASNPEDQKLRNATLLNAYDNNRRWAETFVAQLNYKSAREKLGAAQELWTAFDQSESQTSRLKKLTGKLANDSLAIISNDAVPWSEKTITWLEQVASEADALVGELKFGDKALEKLTPYPEQHARLYRVLTVLASNSGTSANPRNVFKGQIQQFIGGKAFGFLVDEKGERLWFNKNEIRGNDSGWPPHVGSKVMFMLGVNSQGPVARNIRIVL